jgi:hypothetical protein
MTDLIDIDGQRCCGRVPGLDNVRRASLHPARRPTDIRSWRERTSQRALKVELAVRYSGESYVDQRSSRLAVENGVVEFVEASGSRSHESCCRNVWSGRCTTPEFSPAYGPNDIVEGTVGLTCHRNRLVAVSGYVSYKKFKSFQFNVIIPTFFDILLLLRNLNCELKVDKPG